MRPASEFARRVAITSALGTAPFAAVQVHELIVANGSIIHMSKAEWAVFTLVAALALWLATAAVLAAAAVLGRGSALVAAALAAAAFAAAGTALEPGLWRGFLRPLDNGLGYWIVVGGLIATGLAGVGRKGRRLS